MSITTWEQWRARVPARVHGFFPPTAVPHVARGDDLVVFTWGRVTLGLLPACVADDTAPRSVPVASAFDDVPQYAAPDLTFVSELLVVQAHENATTLPADKAARARELADASLAWTDMGGGVSFTRPPNAKARVIPCGGRWDDGPYTAGVFTKAAKRAKLRTFRVFREPGDDTGFCLLPVDRDTPRVLVRVNPKGGRA